MKDNELIDKGVELLHAVTDEIKDTHETLSKKMKQYMDMNLIEGIIDKEEYAKNVVYKYEQIYGCRGFEPGMILKGKDASDTWFYKKKRELDENDEHFFEKRYK